jgi:hypothetical protein
MPVWQPDLDRTAGKHSAWQVHYREWFSLARYAAEMKEGGMKDAYHQLIDKNWNSRRLDKLILNPIGGSEQEAEGTAWLARQFLDRHPDGEVLIYFTWPEMERATELRKSLKLKPWQPLPEERMASLRASFEYAAADRGPMLERIKAALPEDQANRLRVIPAGALLAALDEKLKSGVGEFYKDGTMLRTGLPRYALAALRHAAVHGSHPRRLDATLFNDPKAYPPDALDPDTPKGQMQMTIKDEEYDNGPHYPITPEAKKLIDDAIWELTRR